MTATVVIDGDGIRLARILAVRSALYIECVTTMRHSRLSMLKLANEITGEHCRTKRAAYLALNAYIVENLGDKYDKPLP